MSYTSITSSWSFPVEYTHQECFGAGYAFRLVPVGAISIDNDSGSKSSPNRPKYTSPSVVIPLFQESERIGAYPACVRPGRINPVGLNRRSAIALGLLRVPPP